MEHSWTKAPEGMELIKVLVRRTVAGPKSKMKAMAGLSTYLLTNSMKDQTEYFVVSSNTRKASGIKSTVLSSAFVHKKARTQLEVERELHCYEVSPVGQRRLDGKLASSTLVNHRIGGDFFGKAGLTLENLTLTSIYGPRKEEGA